ncbi:MAG: hypothetical protein IPM68_14305 [Flavobacteriales bacterium]|nr:hypothetical protein [Flavobacteriales bacterium]
MSIGMLALMVWVAVSIQDLRSTRNHPFMFSLAALFMLFFLPKVVIILFHGLEDLIEGGRWLFDKLTPGDPVSTGRADHTAEVPVPSRPCAVGHPFAGVLYGITHGRRNFRIERVHLNAPNLPRSLRWAPHRAHQRSASGQLSERHGHRAKAWTSSTRSA